MRTILTAPVSSWLTDCVSRHFPAGTAPDQVSFRAVIEGRLTDRRKAQGKRHRLASLLSVLVAGLAAARSGPLAVAQEAAGRGQEVLAEHGCRRSPRTGRPAAPSASMLDRLGRLLDPDELEAPHFIGIWRLAHTRHLGCCPGDTRPPSRASVGRKLA